MQIGSWRTKTSWNRITKINPAMPGINLMALCFFWMFNSVKTFSSCHFTVSTVRCSCRSTVRTLQWYECTWLYLRLRSQWRSEGALSMTGMVKRADRQRWSCRSPLTSCRTDSESRGAPLHSLDLVKDSASTVPFSAFLCFRGACKRRSE